MPRNQKIDVAAGVAAYANHLSLPMQVTEFIRLAHFKALLSNAFEMGLSFKSDFDPLMGVSAWM